MKKAPKYLVLAFAGCLLAASIVAHRTIELGRGAAVPAFLENMDPAGKMLGPEGIQFDPRGNLYVGDAQSLVWSFESGGSPRIYAHLDQVHRTAGTGAANGPIHAGGMAFDEAGYLYVSAFGFAGGSVLRVNPSGCEVNFFARDIGVANCLVITQNSNQLWVSDCRGKGRLLRYRLGGSLPAHADLTVEGLSYPNGLAFGKDEKLMYAAETYTGYLVRIDTTAENPRVNRIANLRGGFAVASLDGLAFDPRDRERRFLYVAENLRGMFTVLDLQAQPVRVIKRIRLALMGGRPCPASMVIHAGYLYFTDLWSCNPIRILLGNPRLHRSAYRFKVNDLSAAY